MRTTLLRIRIRLVERLAPLAGVHRRWCQATTEYALVLLGAAVIALLVVAWATSGGGAGKIGHLFDRVLDEVVSRVEYHRNRDAGGRRSRRGQATVELALALPVLCMLLLGVVQLAVVVRDQLGVIDIARVGARAASVAADPGAAATVCAGGIRRTADASRPRSTARRSR